MANMISEISLCNVPIMPTHQIDFETIEKQREYFESKRVRYIPNCKYQPRTGTIKVKGYVDTFNNCNYGYYTNEYNGTSKTFYFWIVQKRALARETTELTIQLDVFQTWFFDVHMERCFIERMHTASDNIYEHTYPESFELGDYVNIQQDKIEEMQGDMDFFIAVTDSQSGNIGGLFANNYSGFRLRYYAHSDYNNLTSYISDLCDAGKGDAIAFIFQFPHNFKDKVMHSLSSGSFIDNLDGCFGINKIITQLQKFVFKNIEYVPKNKKLLSYPFMMLSVNAPNGSNVVLKYENFVDRYNMWVTIYSTLTQNPTFSCVPAKYNGKEHSFEDSIETNCYGLCSWNNDNFANWYAQHQNSIQAQSKNASASYNTAGINAQNSYDTNMGNLERSTYTALATTGLNAVGGLLSNPLGSVTSTINGGMNAVTNAENGVNSLNTDLSNTNRLNTTNYQNTIRSIMANVSDASIQPNTCKGDTSGSGLDVARSSATFYLNQMGIKPEYAEKIDMYFQMYGYQVNIVDYPRIDTRERWNYIKTVGAVATGNVPLEDRQAICDLYDNGFTVWHYEQFFYHYEIDNLLKGV